MADPNFSGSQFSSSRGGRGFYPTKWGTDGAIINISSRSAAHPVWRDAVYVALLSRLTISFRYLQASRRGLVIQMLVGLQYRRPEPRAGCKDDRRCSCHPGRASRGGLVGPEAKSTSREHTACRCGSIFEILVEHRREVLSSSRAGG